VSITAAMLMAAMVGADIPFVKPPEILPIGRSLLGKDDGPTRNASCKADAQQ
jgi:hypothetical protein